MTARTRLWIPAEALVAVAARLFSGSRSRPEAVLPRPSWRFAAWLAPLLALLLPSVAHAGAPPAAFVTGHVYWASYGDPSPDAAGDGMYDVTSGGSTFTEFASGVSAYGQFAWSLDLRTAYITQRDNGTVLAITAGGVVSTFASGINGPIGLVMTTDGHLLVAAINDGAIYDITSGGVPGTPLVTGLGSPVNMMQLDDGNVLSLDQFGTIFELAYPGTAVTPFATGIAPYGFTLAKRSDGQLFVSSYDGGSVGGGVYDVTGGGDFGQATAFATGTDGPLTVDGEGRLLQAPVGQTWIDDISTGSGVTFASNLTGGISGRTTYFALATVPALVVLPALVISPTTPAVAPLGAITFGATGGVARAYTFAFAPGGNLSTGSLDANGNYVAGALGGVSDTIQVTDLAGSSTTTTVTVTAALAVANTPQPILVFPGQSVDFVASGGTGAGTYAWSILTAGSGVPTVDGTTGVYIAGAGSPAGTGADVVQVLDANGTVATATVEVSASITLGDAGVDSGAADSGGADASPADAAPGADATSGADSGVAFDSGARDGAAGESASSPPGNSGGCTLVDGSGSNVAGAVGVLLGLALIVRRRRALSFARA